MKFNKVLKEAAAEVTDSGYDERVNISLGNQEMDHRELREKAPVSYKVIMAAIKYAKSILKIDLSPNNTPADITLKASGNLIITPDGGKPIPVELSKLNLSNDLLNSIKVELNKFGEK